MIGMRSIQSSVPIMALLFLSLAAGEIAELDQDTNNLLELMSSDRIQPLMNVNTDSENSSQPHCVTFGICHQTSPTKFQPCVSNTSAQHLTDTKALTLLQEMCPHLAPKGVNAPLVCCDAEQVHVLDQGMTLPRQFFGRCPACLRSFIRLWCEQACSPRQSTFQLAHAAPKSESNTRLKRNTPFEEIANVKDQAVLANIIPRKGSWVSSVDLHIAVPYVNSLWQTCKSVQYVGTNRPAVELMCGSKGKNCTAMDWLDYLGNLDKNPYLPFGFNWKYKAEPGYEQLNLTALPCQLPPDETTFACSCQDCEASCGPDVPYPKPRTNQCYFAGVDCYTFLAVFVFAGFSLILLVMIVLQFLVDSNSIFKYGSAHSEDDIASYKGAPGALDQHEISMREKFGHAFEKKLERICVDWGQTCYEHALWVLAFGLSVSLILSSGLIWLRFTTDPVELWSAPGSQARNEKDFYDENFGPFYRTEQLIITPTNQSFIVRMNDDFDNVYYGPVYNLTFLQQVLELQTALAGLSAVYETRAANGSAVQHTVTLPDICFKPMAPQHDVCAIQSALGWFQNNATRLAMKGQGWDENVDFLAHIQSCTEAPAQVRDTTKLGLPCLSDYGGPVFPYVALGGFNESNDYMSARALVITFVVENSVHAEQVQRAEAWEAQFIAFLHNYTQMNTHLNISYMAERSIQDEIKRQSQSDVLTIVVSYLFMFGYIAFALGQYNCDCNNLFTLLVHSKAMLGVAGVLIVALSVTSSIGVYAWCGIPATMIILEVQPFLVLAVGVDNIFIFVQAYQRDRHSKSECLRQRIGRISGEVIPSMLLSSIAECCCFFLGALSTMPAVKVFSLYAGMAIFFNFFLQVTCFLALFTLDIRRQEAGRLEICCCAVVESARDMESDGRLYTIFKKYYTPFILSKYVRIIVCVVFMASWCSSIAVIDKIELGLDAKVSMPEDSYVLTYFNGMQKYLSVGPPVYFVVKGDVDYSDVRVQNALCGSAGCDHYSLSSQIYNAAKYSNRSYLAQPVLNWLDDYFDWLRPTGEPPCCRLFHNNQSFCPATVPPFTNGSTQCESCEVRFTHGRPSPQDFWTYLPDFLIDNPSEKCAKGGHAAYGNAVHVQSQASGLWPVRFAYGQGQNESRVRASAFMTYHTPLKTSADFISALEQARKMARNMSAVFRRAALQANPGLDPASVEVYPYSVFYVYYEQYLSISWSAMLECCLSVSVIFIVTAVFLGFEPWAAAMICVTLVLILVDMMALMYWWRIDFNAISLVNLVMAVGISVEFCSHTVRAFTQSTQPSRVERAREALSTMGSSVLSGITLTKFGGISVLAFAHSKIFQVYYFRMYLGIVLFGAAHGLVFLPVLLSFLGPPVNKRRLLAWMQADLDAYASAGVTGSAAAPSQSLDGRQQEGTAALVTHPVQPTLHSHDSV